MLPAHDYMLKCSHTFNVLDTRGAVGVTERQALVWAHARPLAAGGGGLSGPAPAAGVSLVERADGDTGSLEPGSRPATSAGQPTGADQADGQAAAAVVRDRHRGTTRRRPGGCAGPAARAPAGSCLNELRLAHGAISIQGTPRRLVVHVEDLAAGTARPGAGDQRTAGRARFWPGWRADPGRRRLCPQQRRGAGRSAGP